MTLGMGDYKYELIEGWAKIPEYFQIGGLGPVHGFSSLACDSKDRVYGLNRGNHSVMIFDTDGNFVSCWGEGHFRLPHGIYIDPDDNVYVTDAQTHTVEKFTLGGELLMTLGKRDWAGGTLRGEPFNKPTGCAVGPDGSVYVADGYGNRRVHKFSPTGELLRSWGDQGTGPGQFALPHFVDVDGHGTVYVTDRENRRVQLFNSDGEYLTEWGGLNRPSDIHIDREKDIIYLDEAGGVVMVRDVEWQVGHIGGQPHLPPRISIRDLKGKVLSSWEGTNRDGTGVLGRPHGIGIDSHGNIYEGSMRFDTVLQKFAKVS